MKTVNAPANGPSYPATSPYVISVGGTTLAPATNARGWSETTWPRSGGGCSAFEPKPSFQTDSGCTHRTGNDVAAVAEDLSVRDSSPAEQRGYSWIDVGGTSASSPIIAAVEALSESAERSLGPAAFYQSPGSLFDIVSGSDGACGGSYLCTAGGGYDGPTGNGTPDGALSLSAPPPPPELSVAGQGTGSALITSSPAGIECGSTCDASFPLGTKVTLSAAPASGSTFLGWQGACSGTGPCTVTLAQGAAVGADFRGPPPPSGWSAGVLAPPAGANRSSLEAMPNEPSTRLRFRPTAACARRRSSTRRKAFAPTKRRTPVASSSNATPARDGSPMGRSRRRQSTPRSRRAGRTARGSAK